MRTILKNRKIMLAICFAIIHTLITFVTDRGIFVFPNRELVTYSWAVFDYSLCKVLCLLALIFIYYYVLTMILPGREASILYKVTKSALPYIVVIIAVAAIKLPQGYVTNDEYSILNDAINLTHSTWFNVWTPYYYTVCLMIMPFSLSPIIFKLILEFFTVGYVTFRSRQYYGNKIGCISYLLFLLYPFIAYTTSAHRLPIYFLLYLLIITKLYYDHLEGKHISIPAMGIILLTGALLTQWRTEGIYLAGLLPILMLIAYPHLLKNKKLLVTGIIMFIVSQYIISIPQNIFMNAQLKDAANDRMKPFYAYTITNMYRNGLDLEKNKEDLEIVDKYLSLDVIKAINEHYEDINYEDVLILYQDGFVGVRPEAGVQEFVDYSDALKRIFKNNPDVFIRTRIGAFNYAARPFRIDFSEGGVKGLIKGGISVVKTLSYNLYIPLLLVAVYLIISLIKRKWFDFFVMGGLLCHWFIVFILAPASYFKYYFPVYIVAYFYILNFVMDSIDSHKNK